MNPDRNPTAPQATVVPAESFDELRRDLDEPGVVVTALRDAAIYLSGRHVPI